MSATARSLDGPASTREMFMSRALMIWVAVLAVLLLSSTAMVSREYRCSTAPERPRALDLTRPADAAHLAADLDAVAKIASAYRDFIRAQPLGSSSLNARLSSATRPDRAYRYCRAILMESVSRTHQVDVRRFFKPE